LDGLQALVEGKEAEVDKLDQIVELENAEKEVVQDVKQAFFDYQKSLIQVESTLKRVDYRERLARLAEHRLGKNEIQVSEYIQAEIDLLRERTELHRALKDYFSAKAKLNRAVGRREFLPIEEKYGE
jgi:outer membrane protein TolC